MLDTPQDSSQHKIKIDLQGLIRLLAKNLYAESDVFVRELVRRFPDYVLEVIPVTLQTPYKVDGVLYISDRQALDLDTTGLIDIYHTRMFITSNNRDILPSWANFVRG